MKIKTLNIENFLSIGRIECSLEDKGLVLIQGENRDDSSQQSNGSGKSSILDAIAFCFHGETARGESGDGVINRNAKKNCCVSIVVSEGDDDYRISRYRKHSAHKNDVIVERLVDKTWRDISGGTVKLSQVIINKIVGCTADVFNAAVYAGQEQMPDLPGSTDKFLKMLIEEAAGINRLQDAYELARKQLLSVKQSLDQKLHQKDVAATRLEAKKESLERANRMLESWEEANKAGIKERTDRINALKKLAAEKKKVFEGKSEAIREVSKELSAIKERLNSVSAESVRERELRSVFDREDRLLMSLKSSLKSAEGDALSGKKRLLGVGDIVGSPCGECGKTYQESDIQSAKDNATSALRNKIATLKETKQQFVAQQEIANRASAALTEHVSNMTDVSDLIKQQSTLTVQIKAFETEKADISNRIEDVKRQSADLALMKKSENPHRATIKIETDEIAKINALISDHNASLSAAQDEVALSEAAAKVFSPSGVRAHILDTVTPFLNMRTSEYLSLLSDGNISAVWNTLTATAKGDLREKFSIEVSSSTGGKTFKSLSGGEKRKVRLATFLALQDLMASRATKPINLFIADEIDAALDEAGLERLMAVLESKARDKGTVLTVSHNSLSDWIRNTVTIVKEKGYSRMEGESLRA